MLTGDDYHLHDHEANSFIPYLINKVRYLSVIDARFHLVIGLLFTDVFTITDFRVCDFPVLLRSCCLPAAFLLPSCCLPAAFLLPSYCLHSILLYRAVHYETAWTYSGVYISNYLFSLWYLYFCQLHHVTCVRGAIVNMTSCLAVGREPMEAYIIKR